MVKLKGNYELMNVSRDGGGGILGEFSEILVEKMSKYPQPPLGGMFWNDHFGHLAYIDDLMEEGIDVPEESQAPEKSNFDE